jgi:hypothetical protein
MCRANVLQRRNQLVERTRTGLQAVDIVLADQSAAQPVEPPLLVAQAQRPQLDSVVLRRIQTTYSARIWTLQSKITLPMAMDP